MKIPDPVEPEIAPAADDAVAHDEADLNESATVMPGPPMPAEVRFRILRPHARGGIGQLWVALDKELHREVALKELQPGLEDQAAVRERFLLEAEITGSLEHPGVVPIYGLGQYPDGRPF